MVIIMRSILSAGTPPFYLLNAGVHRYPLVVSIPHSGTLITEKMNAALYRQVKLPNSDWYLPELYDFLAGLDITVIVNNMNRYVADPNRAPDDRGDGFKNSVIYESTTHGHAMYPVPPDEAERKYRMDSFYYPYHMALSAALEEKKRRFSHTYLIDLHSYGYRHGCDLILGNRNGQSCSASFFSAARGLLEKQGYVTADNKPFSGGYITRHYGGGYEALQIEHSYQIYIDDRDYGNEELPEINRELFCGAKAKLRNFITGLLDYISGL